MASLKKAAKVAMEKVLALTPGEEVLIITNFEGEVFQIAKAIYEETRALGGKPVMMVQPEKTTYDYAERVVLEAMESAPDICLCLNSKKTGKDPFGMSVGYIGRDGKKYEHVYMRSIFGDRRVRGFWSPTVTLDMFQRCVDLDYDEMRSSAAKLVEAMKGKKEVHVTAPAGTDVTITIAGRPGRADDGDFRSPGKGGNLPAGEVYISPVVASTKGVIVFDGTVDLVPHAVLAKTPVKVEFKDGYVSKVTGGEEAKGLLAVIQKGEQMAREKGLKTEERNARHLGELGIGLNHKATMTGNMLEDEKVGGTVHFAIGANYDNDGPALIHQDCLVKKPNIWVDGEQIMKGGKLLI